MSPSLIPFETRRCAALLGVSVLMCADKVVGGDMFDHEMRDAAERVLHACRKRGLKLATAESCTGMAWCRRDADGDLGLVGRCRARLCDLRQRGQARDAGRVVGCPAGPWRGERSGGARWLQAPSPARVSILPYRSPASPGRRRHARQAGRPGPLRRARAGHDIVAERHVFPGDRDTIRRVAVITALTILASLAER